MMHRKKSFCRRRIRKMRVYSLKMTKMDKQQLVEMALQSDDGATTVANYLESQPVNAQIRRVLFELSKHPLPMSKPRIVSKCLDLLMRRDPTAPFSDEEIAITKSIVTVPLDRLQTSTMNSILAHDRTMTIHAIIFMVNGPNANLVLSMMHQCGFSASADYSQTINRQRLTEMVSWLSKNKGIKWDNNTSGGVLAQIALERWGWYGTADEFAKNSTIPDTLSEAILDPRDFAARNGFGGAGAILKMPYLELQKKIWNNKVENASTFEMAISLLKKLETSETWVKSLTNQEKLGISMRVIKGFLTNQDVPNDKKEAFIVWVLENPTPSMGLDSAADFMVSCVLIDHNLADLILDDVLSKDCPKAISRVTMNLDYSIPRYDRISKILRSSGNWDKADNKFISFTEAMESASQEEEEDFDVAEFDKLSWYSRSTMVKQALFGLSEKQQAVLLVFLSMIVGIPIMVAMNSFKVSGQDMVDNSNLKHKAEIIALEKDLATLKTQIQAEIEAAELKALLHPESPRMPVAPVAPSSEDQGHKLETIVPLIIQHEGLLPGQTPFRYTNSNMRRWNKVWGYPIDKKSKKAHERRNFIFLKDPTDVPRVVTQQFVSYHKNPSQYGLPPNPTLRDAINKFDQTGAASKISFLAQNVPNLNIDLPLSTYL